MGIFKRILRVGKQQVEKGLDKLEDDIKTLESNLAEYVKSKNDIVDSLNKLKAMKKKDEQTLEETKLYIRRLKAVAKKALECSDEKSAKEAFELINIRKSEETILEKNINTNKMAIENVESKLKVIDKKIREFNYKIQELKTKKTFSNSINEINKIVNDVNSSTSGLGENKDIIDKIDTEYYIAEVQIENMDKESNIEDLMNEYDYDFESFKKEILEDKDNENI